MDNKKLTELLLEQYRTSPIIKDMREADKYYRCENININEKKRGYKNPKTGKFEEIDSSNERIASGFLRQSVNQKVAYGFGKPFVIAVDCEDDRLKEKYSEAWDNYITPDFRKQIKSIAKEAINNGIGWGFIYIDSETQELRIINVKSETIYPKWTDGNHEKTEAIVRDYYDKVYTEEGIKTVNKVEFWDNKNVEKYVYDGTVLTLEPDGILTHLADNQSWDKIPFIFLKSSEDEMPLLKLIKSYIDAYDTLNSNSVDTLVDDTKAIIVLKGLSAEIKDLVEAKQFLTSLGITAVDEQGDVSYLQANINIDNVQKKLENLKKDIKEFSCTVNTQDIQLGNNPSGVALKASYQDLDTYMNDLEVEFELFMQNFKYFFDKWLVFKGEFTEQELAQTDITITLNRDMMMNETEMIENTAKLSGLVSQETLDNYNPAVETHEIEQERREQEENNRIEKDNPYNFNQLEPETTEFIEEE